MLRHVAHVVPVDQHGSLLYVVEAGEQAGDGALAGAGGADDGDGLAGVDMQIQVAQDRLVAVVAKGDMLEIYRSLDRRQGLCIRVVYDLDGHVQYLEDALGRHAGALQLRILLAQVADGVEETVDIEREGDQDADEQRALRDQQSAVDDGEGDGYRGYHLDQGQDERGDAAGFQVGVAVVGVQVVELGAVAVLARQALDHAHAGDVLLQGGVDHGDGGAGAAEGALGEALPEGGDDEHDGQHGEAEQGQRDVHNQHDGDDADQCDERTEDGEQARTEHGFQHSDIALQARHDAPDLRAVVEAEREPLQMGEHVGTEMVEHLLSRPGHGPDLPVLRLPHQDVDHQQHDADDA